MTDLEMTRLCAEAMGLNRPGSVLDGLYEGQEWRPLQEDAQAMALVKKFKMDVSSNVDGSWDVCLFDPFTEVVDCPDLNRVIVECVAKMHSSSTGKASR